MKAWMVVDAGFVLYINPIEVQPAHEAHCHTCFAKFEDARKAAADLIDEKVDALMDEQRRIMALEEPVG